MSSYKIKKVLMAERSDIYRDVRVQKEATSLTKGKYKVHVYGFRSRWRKETASYAFGLFTLPVISREHRLLRNITMALNMLIISILVVIKKADLYHAHNTMFLIAMYISSKIHRGKFIYDSHEVQWERSKIEGLLEKYFVKKVDSIINVSAGRASIQAKRYEIPVSRITVIANYPVLNNPTCKYVQRASRNLRFIFSGGFTLDSNRLDSFLVAVKEVPNITFSLLAFGYGNSKEELLRMIKKHDLKGRVRFLPMVTSDKVLETISRYDMAVNLMTNRRNLVSLQYPAINKMYEYLAAGLPIIMSDLPAFVEEFEDEGVGIVVNPDDVNSIRSALDFASNNRHVLEAMKKKALELSRAKYNWATQEEKLLSLYAGLCK